MMDYIFKWFENLQSELPVMYLVGGAVRDWLLEKPTKDIDIVCRDAEKCSQIISRKKNVTVIPFKKKVDVPCYRIVDRDDKNFVIDISEMRGDNIYEDLKCRDFRMNAMAMEIKPGGISDVLIDPLGGQNDLRRKLISLCSDHAISDDPLRTLRAIRFSAQMGFAIGTNTQAAICHQAGRLKESAPERIMSELIRIFNISRSIDYIRLMDRLGLLEVVLPEIQPMKGCSQNLYHHQDVWEHSLSVLEVLETIVNDAGNYFGDHSFSVLHCLEKNNRLPILKMAALLHDVAKPVTRIQDPKSGKIAFYSHDAKGKLILYKVAVRLKMSQKNRVILEMLAGEHIHVVNLAKAGVKKGTIVRFFRKHGDDAVLLIILSMADSLSKKGPLATKERKKAYLDWCRNIISEYFVDIKKYLADNDLIDGNDLIQMGIAQGPRMGKILRKVRDARDSGMLQNKQDALVFVKSMF
ncbi:MAG: HD domain-containing protein [Desulfobacterales bacterium]